MSEMPQPPASATRLAYDELLSRGLDYIDWPSMPVQLPCGRAVCVPVECGGDTSQVSQCASEVVTDLLVKQVGGLHDQLEDTRIDKLTGLLTRDAFDELYPGWLQFRAERVNAQHEQVVCFVVDVNGLKSVNDRFGHAAGDELLVGAAARYAQVFEDIKPEDKLLARTGGDEVLVLIAVPSEGFNSGIYEEGIPDLLQNFPYNLRGDDRVFEGSASVGYAYCDAIELLRDKNQNPEDRQVLNSLKERADTRMYEEKHAR